MDELIKVETNNITKLASLASKIWHEFWTIILKEEQINFMVEKFQSENAITNQIKNENYEYYFINLNGESAGYLGISTQKNYIFLSKLYILKDYRSKGLGKAAFDKIKELTKEKNLDKIQLTVNKYNENTINAYKKWGFKITDSVVTDIGSGFVMDDYIMEYCL